MPSEDKIKKSIEKVLFRVSPPELDHVFASEAGFWNLLKEGGVVAVKPHVTIVRRKSYERDASGWSTRSRVQSFCCIYRMPCGTAGLWLW